MANIRNIDLNLLAVFDALFDTRSATRAAERLAVTQPTVSGQLKQLRHVFADELFVRSSHGILPTPRAEALAGPVKALLANAQALIKTAAFDPASAEATIRLCGSDYLQYAFITPLIKEVRKLAPNIKVQVSPRPATGVADLLARGEIDLCISAREVALQDLPARLLCSERYVCVARKKHPLRARRISMQQLCAYDHLLVDPTGRSLAGPIDTILASLGQQRRVVAAVPTFPILFDLLESDNFLAFIPARLLKAHGGSLKVFETKMATPTFDVVANWHPRVSEDAQHKWLRDLLVKVTKAG